MYSLFIMKKKLRYVIYLLAIFLIFLLSACSIENTSNNKLENALIMAKGNRLELEKVLAHYNSDSLKLKAAVFLIENMPGHYSYSNSYLLEEYYSETDRLLTKLHGKNSDEIRDSINLSAKRLNLKNCHKVMDIEIISSDFLISNIDRAFESWHEKPWSEHLSFEDFCEYILPYKVHELQPFDNWREEFGDFCTMGLENLQYCEMFKHSTYNAALVLSKNFIDSIKPFLSWSLDFPIYKVSTKVKMPFGKCDDYSDLMTSLLRAQGIPAIMDYTPQWAYRDLGHKWNCILAQTGKNIPFSAFFTAPGEPHKIEEKLAKVFRHTYSINDDIEFLNRKEKFVPLNFRNIFQKDVTQEYIKCTTIHLEDNKFPDGFLYLGVSDGDSWTPIHYGYCERGSVYFEKMGLDCVYILMKYMDNGNIEYLTPPFIIDPEGNIQFFIPDKKTTVTAKLYRKYPVLEYASKYSQRLIGGRFEASNDPSFNNTETIHIVNSGNAITHEFYISDSIPAYRYWRYIQSEPDTYCSIAEIIFFSQDSNQPVYGKVIGTNGCKHPEYNRIKENVFDKNWLTAFDAPIDHGAWIGMDFGKSINMQRVIFVGRGDGNSIELGDVYQLFYWEDSKWKSIGKQKATRSFVDFSNIPSNSILLLKDLSKGKNIRIFTLNKDLCQEWH